MKTPKEGVTCTITKTLVQQIMEEALIALKAIQRELDELRQETRETGKNVTEQVTHNMNNILEEKLMTWIQKHKKLEEIVEDQERRIYFLEKQERKRNLVFFGIQEIETSYASLEKNIINWIEQYFSIKLSYSDIQEVKRIGKKSERPRPIVVTFSTLGTKIKIIKNKDTIKDTPYYFKEDFPKQVLEKRRELQEQVKLEKEKGNIAKIKYDKLVILKPNYKRQLHTSPTNVSQVQSDTSTHVNKKNKKSKAQSPARRSNSIPESVLKPSMLNFLVNKKDSIIPGQDTENKRKNL